MSNTMGLPPQSIGLDIVTLKRSMITSVSRIVVSGWIIAVQRDLVGRRHTILTPELCEAIRSSLNDLGAVSFFCLGLFVNQVYS